MSSIYWFLLGVLSVWRLTHLLYAEDGPWDLLVRFRQKLGNGVAGRLLDCFLCLSLWIAAPFGYFLGVSWGERFLLWLALSGGAILINEFAASVHSGSATFVEDKEASDVVLRSKTPGATPETPKS
jgi:hypothetical protein